MPYTSHGHAYGVIDTDQPRPTLVARCGGPRLCKKCATEAAATPSEARQMDEWRVEIDRYRLEIARLRAIVSRVIEIPREPEHLPDDDAGLAYKRGWQDARALVDKALLPEEEQS
ncbi:hypothetical protein [Nonomuraea wenchangensis]|uniref:Uncharacterized protein n=1 Tax=Nonomuraea wenchangensis TaxID=568860 RepID=A0A1I0EVI1_9ACTN|nr:hypothetical protein [Nonomuraea wenchangensis]SET49616.1 hypothetical protein SAMN05421811_103224 [Nonomuraea wenchangensis]